MPVGRSHSSAFNTDDDVTHMIRDGNSQSVVNFQQMADTCLISYLVDLLKAKPTRNILKPSVPRLKTKAKGKNFFCTSMEVGGGSGAEAPSAPLWIRHCV